MTGVGAVALIFRVRWTGDRVLVPPKVFKSMSVYAICLSAFSTRCSLLIYTYYIPIYYQAVREHDATRSGVDILPYMLAVVISVIAAGRIVSITGRYWHFLVLGPIPGAIGAGLMYIVTPTTASIKASGYQSASARSMRRKRCG